MDTQHVRKADRGIKWKPKLACVIGAVMLISQRWRSERVSQMFIWTNKSRSRSNDGSENVNAGLSSGRAQTKMPFRFVFQIIAHVAAHEWKAITVSRKGEGTMKFTKAHENSLRDFMDMMEDGCVSISDWKSGYGKNSRPRALPPFVRRVEKGQYQNTPKRVNYLAKWYFRIYPKRRIVLVLDREAMMGFLFESSRGKEF